MKLSIILRFCLWFMGISMAFPSLSQTMLVTNGNTSSRIILKENNQISWTAANLLQTFIQKVTSCKLPVVISQTPRKGDILIGGQSPAEVTEDGFYLVKKTVLYMGLLLYWSNIWVSIIGERMNILLPLQKR